MAIRDDLEERGKFTESSATPMQERVGEFIDGDMYEIVTAILDNAPPDVFATTLKAMLQARHNSLHAFKLADREQSQLDFSVFAKSFCNVCLDAIETSLGETK